MAIGIEIAAGATWPGSELSNFAHHPFTFQGVDCESMEGFLQSLKCPDPDEQRRICRLVGAQAKAAGKAYDWKASGELHWLGQTIDRYGTAYQQLLDDAYLEMAMANPRFIDALMATGEYDLVHPIGRCHKNQTVLTRDEFTGRLLWIRENLRDVYPVTVEMDHNPFE